MALRRAMGSWTCHFAIGYCFRSSPIWASSVGEVTVVVRSGQALALEGLLRIEHRPERGHEIRPHPGLGAIGEGLGPVRIVQVQDLGLGEVIGGAEAARMIGVALDLGGPAHVAFDQDPLRGPVGGQHGREVDGLARDERFGSLAV